MSEIVSATVDMIAELHGRTMPRTGRVLAVVEDDEVLGVTGFYPQNGRLILFADISDQARAEMWRHKRTLLACAWKIMDMASELGMPVLAYADPEIPGSEVLVAHLGFHPIGQGVWEWLGQPLQ